MSSSPRLPVPPDGPTTPTKVLYIVGKGRSGSTLLDIALGSLDGYFACGELHFIWDKDVVAQRRCGCGLPILECEVWSPALEHVFDAEGFDAAGMRAWHDEVHTWKRAVKTMRTKPGRTERWPAMHGYATGTGRLYRAIQAQTGARVLIDSSKWPLGAGALGLIPGVEPYVIQLVRDPRAVAHSWQRRKIQPDMLKKQEMPRFGPVHSSLSWSIRNAVSRHVRKRAPRQSMVLRYEDFVSDPHRALQQIVDLVGEPTNLGEVLQGRTLHVGGNHTVAGNPSRFVTGEVKVRPDLEWSSHLSRAHRTVVTAMTFHGLYRYGYRIRSKTAPGSTEGTDQAG